MMLLNAAQIERDLRQNYAQAAEAQKAGDYVRLLQLNESRQELLKDVRPGLSEFLDPWAEDARVIASAEKAMRQTRYRDAVAALQARWNLRQDAELVNGRLGVEIVRASLGAVPVDGQQVLDDRAMNQVLDGVIKADPAQVLARVLSGWMIQNDPKEELLRLDLRDSSLALNRMLLPIRTSLVKDWTDYTESRQSVLAIQSRMPVPRGISKSTFRTVLAACEYRLGENRQLPQDENAWWTRWLDNPTLDLRDLAGRKYRVSDGILWRMRQEGGTARWELLFPSDAGDDWTPYTLTILRFTEKPDAGSNTAPGQAPDIGKSAEDTIRRWLVERLRTRVAVGDAFPSIGDCSLQAVAPDESDLPYVLRSAIPHFVASPQGTNDSILRDLRDAWTASKYIRDRQLQGRCFVLTPAFVQRLFWSSPPKQHEETAPDGKGLRRRIILPLDKDRPIAVFERGTPMHVDWFSSGSHFLIDSRGNAVSVNQANMLEVKSPWHGRAVIPLLGSRYRAKALQSVLLPMIGVLDNRKDNDVLALREILRRYRRDGSASDEVMIQAISFDDKALLDIANMGADRVSAELLFHYHIRKIRESLARIPYGVDPRLRLVLPVPETNETLQIAGKTRTIHELGFRDVDGGVVNTFYKLPDLIKLRDDTRRDFVLPSFRVVPSPLALQEDSRLPSTDPQPEREDTELDALNKFLVERAQRALRDGDLHVAAVASREARMPPLPFKQMDSRTPRNREEFIKLLADLSRTAEAGARNLAARLVYAQSLRQSGRTRQADEVLRCVASEWSLAGLPLFEQLRGYTESYGYVPDAQFLTSYQSITKQLGDLRPADANQIVPGPVGFDPKAAAAALADGKLGEWLEQFYDARPSLTQYAAAKRWVLEHQANLLLRSPRRKSDYSLRFWTPAFIRPEALGGENKLKSDNWTWEEIVVCDPGAKTPPAQWLSILHEAETSSKDDCLRLRELLLSAATLFRREGAKGGLTDAPAILANLNAVGSLVLAGCIDADLPADFSMARFGAFAAEAGSLELAIFIEPRLEAAGLDIQNARKIRQPVSDLLYAARRVATSSDKHYLGRRFFWFEYEPLVDDFCEYLKSHPAQPVQ